MVTLTEAGLYFYLNRSDSPYALPFQKWVNGEVIPAVRKHGVYMTPEAIEKVLLSPDTIIKIATQLKEERLARKEAEAKLIEQAPKAAGGGNLEIKKRGISLKGVGVNIMGGVRIGVVGVMTGWSRLALAAGLEEGATRFDADHRGLCCPSPGNHRNRSNLLFQGVQESPRKLGSGSV